MVSTRKKKNQHKKQLSQSNDTLNDFVIGNIIDASAVENETLESQTSSRLNNLRRITVGEDSECQNQVIENTIYDKIREAIESAVLTIENRIHDFILTAMDNVVIPRVEMAVRSITELSGRGSSSVVQNPGQRNFTGNTVNTPLMSASSRVD